MTGKGELLAPKYKDVSDHATIRVKPDRGLHVRRLLEGCIGDVEHICGGVGEATGGQNPIASTSSELGAECEESLTAQGFRCRGKQRCEVAEVNHDVGSDNQIEPCRQTVEPSHDLAAVEPIIDASLARHFDH